MKKSKKYRFALLFLLSGVAAIHTQCPADGYRNPPPTAEGIAKAGANSAFVDDASAVSYNPANLGFQTNESFVACLTAAQADTT